MTKTYKVNGFYDGEQQHRIKSSFNPSEILDFSENGKTRIIEIQNSDLTGTNDYSIVKITCDTAEECRSEIEGQISEGYFENYKVGTIEEI